MTKRVLAAIIALASTAVVLGQAKPDQATAPQSKTLAMMQGAWIVSTQNGQDASGGPETTFTIKDRTYVQTSGGSVLERGAFMIDESKKPAALNVSVAEGEDAGRSKVGIIEVTDTTIKVKVGSAGGNTRPTDFAVADGFIVLTLTKRKTASWPGGYRSR